jgi:hypothetical protein
MARSVALDHVMAGSIPPSPVIAPGGSASFHPRLVRTCVRLVYPSHARIVCPNCAATLDTHCGRNAELRHDRACAACGELFSPRYVQQRHCSLKCGQRHDRAYQRGPRPHTRKVERPSYEQLQTDLSATGYVAVGRKYGVSDNAVRKWLRWYERDLAAAHGSKAA